MRGREKGKERIMRRRERAMTEEGGGGAKESAGVLWEWLGLMALSSLWVKRPSPTSLLFCCKLALCHPVRLLCYLPACLLVLLARICLSDIASQDLLAALTLMPTLPAPQAAACLPACRFWPLMDGCFACCLHAGLSPRTACSSVTLLDLLLAVFL